MADQLPYDQDSPGGATPAPPRSGAHDMPGGTTVSGKRTPMGGVEVRPGVTPDLVEKREAVQGGRPGAPFTPVNPSGPIVEPTVVPVDVHGRMSHAGVMPSTIMVDHETRKPIPGTRLDLRPWHVIMADVSMKGVESREVLMYQIYAHGQRGSTMPAEFQSKLSALHQYGDPNAGAVLVYAQSVHAAVVKQRGW